MKTAIILVSLLAAAYGSIETNFNQKQDTNALSYPELRGLQRGAIEDSILKLAECIRTIMKEGSDLTQGMVLDPFELKHFDVNLAVPEFVDVKGELKDVAVNGASTFNINQVKLNLILMKADFNVSIERVHADGLYDVVGKLINLIPLNGEGPFKIHFDDINASGFAKLGLVEGHLKLSELHMVLKVGSVEFKIDGLMGKPDISDLVNAILNDLVPQLLEQEQAEITKVIDELAKTVLNPILAQLTLQDLLNIINGAGSGGGICP